MSKMLLSLFFCVGFSSVVNAQLRIGVVGEVEFVSTTGDTIDESGRIIVDSLLYNDAVLDSLEVTDQQRKEIKAMVRSHAIEAGLREKRMYESGASPDEVVQANEDMRSELKSSVSMSLLPHQIQELHFLALRKHVDSLPDSANVFADKSLAAALGLSTSEQQKVRKKAEEVGKKLKKEIEDLRRKAILEVVDVLPPEKKQSIIDRFGPTVFGAGVKLK